MPRSRTARCAWCRAATSRRWRTGTPSLRPICSRDLLAAREQIGRSEGVHVAQVAHRDTFAPTNLLSRGQEIAVEVDEAKAVDILLEAGSMSLHHVLMFHSSPPNRSADRRIGYAIRYIPTYVRQVAGDGDSALLVRGVDEYHHFEPEEPPVTDLAPDAV